MTLVKTEELCRAAEAAHLQMEKLSNKSEIASHVDFVKHGQPQRDRNIQPQRERNIPRNQRTLLDCTKCGTRHVKTNCPAYGKTCFNCNLKNHFSKVCKTNTNSTPFDHSNSQ